MMIMMMMMMMIIIIIIIFFDLTFGLILPGVKIIIMIMVSIVDSELSTAVRTEGTLRRLC